MNKEEYKRAFAGVGPSANAAERILQMEKKKKPCAKRVFLAVLAAALLLGVLAVSANAATDGRLCEGLWLLASGEKINLRDFITNYEEYVDENGNYTVSYDFNVPDLGGFHITSSGGSGIDENGDRWIGASWSTDAIRGNTAPEIETPSPAAEPGE